MYKRKENLETSMEEEHIRRKCTSAVKSSFDLSYTKIIFFYEIFSFGKLSTTDFMLLERSFGEIAKTAFLS